MSDLIEKAVDHGGIIALLIIIVCLLGYYINKHFVPVNKEVFNKMLEEHQSERKALLESINKVAENQNLLQKNVDELRRISNLQIGNQLPREKLKRILKLMAENGLSFEKALKIIDDQDKLPQ